MEIIKRKSGIRYREMYWLNGQPIKSPIFRRKTDCVQWLAKQRSQKVENELYGDLQKLRQIKTIEEFGQEWLKSKEAMGITKSTLRNYESYLRVHICPTFRNRDLKTIQKFELENFQLKLKSTHNAKGANLIITVVKTLFKEALREGYLVKNPAEFIKKFSEDNVRELYWTRSEIDQFLKANYLSDLHDLFRVSVFNSGKQCFLNLLV
ncbi:MAG: phage integrase SAM-like domain-containing protein [Bacteriovorax sp.]|nr:phage integrase SAM-like domain-containing protein [Bacteriovorax sp.]